MRTTLFIAGLIASGVISATGEEAQNASLPEIKASVRFHSDSYGTVPDEIELPASTLLEAKERRVIEGDLGRLPIRRYIRETRKTVSVAFTSCQAALKELVAAPQDATDDVNVADLKKEFQSNLAKAKTALKELQGIAAKLPDNSAMLLAQSTLAILTTPQGFE